MSVIEASTAGFKDMADGTLRLFFDVEPRNAGAALQLFRVRGTAAALAALIELAPEPESAPDKPVQGPPPEPPKPRAKRERMGPLCEWAVMRCQESQFQRWIAALYAGIATDPAVGSPEAAARHALLVFCAADSRKELDTDAESAVRLHTLIRLPYSAWLKTQGTTA